MRALVLLTAIAAAAGLAACGGGDDYTSEDVIEGLKLETFDGGSGITHYRLPDSDCSAEEIVVGEDRVEEYVSAGGETIAANPGRTAAVQTDAECTDEFEQALEALD